MGNYKHYKNLMDAYEQRLTKSQWLGGQGPTDEDNTVCKEMTANGAPTIAHPHTFAWYSLCCKFQDSLPPPGRLPPLPSRPRVRRPPPPRRRKLRLLRSSSPLRLLRMISMRTIFSLRTLMRPLP